MSWASERPSLGELPLFAGCQRRELRALERLGTRVPVPAGRRLLLEGSRGTEVMIVVRGQAACTVGDELVDTFGPGDIFGEIAALDGERRTATVAAETAMEVVVLERAEFEELLRLAPSVTRRLLDMAARRLRRANDLSRV